MKFSDILNESITDDYFIYKTNIVSAIKEVIKDKPSEIDLNSAYKGKHACKVNFKKQINPDDMKNIEISFKKFGIDGNNYWENGGKILFIQRSK